MIELTHSRELTLTAGSAFGRPRHLAAASGVVVAGDCLYVVADDEHHLGVFPASGAGDGHLIRLFPGELAPGLRQRKATKPDLEALLRLPPFGRFAHGALLALPSGSRPNRCLGALLSLDEDGGLAGDPVLVSFESVYVELEARIPALNIEGALVVGDALLLLQRGSRKQPMNAVLRLPLAKVLGALSGDSSLTQLEAQELEVQPVELGAIDGVPLCFTDGAALPDGRIVFTAVAENSRDNYADGPCSGAAIGVLGSDGGLQRIERLAQAHKIEGVHAWLEPGTIELLLVTDADDAQVSASVLRASLPDAR